MPALRCNVTSGQHTEWSHRATAKRILARQGLCRNDPLTGREIRLRRTCKAERAAQIELGKLFEQGAAGRQPETDVTVTQLMDRYAEIADWDLSTRKANEYYIRRVIKPALGRLQVRKVRGPVLDLLYAQLKRRSNLACTGKPFTEQTARGMRSSKRGSARRITRGLTPRTHTMTCTDSTADRTRSAGHTGILRPSVPRPVVNRRSPPHYQGTRVRTPGWSAAAGL